MHDLDRIQAESAAGEEEGFEFEYDVAGPGPDGEYQDSEADFESEDADEYEAAPALSEEEEMELAAELLESASDGDVDRTVSRIVQPREPGGHEDSGDEPDSAEPSDPTEPPQSPDRVPRPRPRLRRRRPRQARYPQRPGGNHGAQPTGGRARAGRPNPKRRRKRRGLLGKALKGIAKKALPIAGRIVGSALLPGVGGAAGAAIGRGVGKAFGLELEGMSPEDQQFEVARGVVRLGAAAAEELEQIGDEIDDEAAAKMAVIRASAEHAPGVVPRSPGPGPGRPRYQRPTSGRWVRQNGRIILLGL